MESSSHYLLCRGRELHYLDFGPQDAPVVVAWHGLARNAHDMDVVARHLAGRFRVICPDTIGRGLSAWSPDPAREYCLDFYVELAESLLDTLGISRCLWLGTSMGGAIGLRAAAGRLRGRIDRLILNDIGPEISAAAVERIRSYAGQPPSFATVRELAQYFRTIYAPFGTLSDAQWLHLTETSLRRLPDGRVTPHYDPQIVQQFIVHPHDYAQWPAWDSLSLPVLCLRGERSDLLLPEVTEQMKRRGPRADVITIPGCGHAPALHVPEQLALIDEFFSAKLVRSGGG